MCEGEAVGGIAEVCEVDDCGTVVFAQQKGVPSMNSVQLWK